MINYAEIDVQPTGVSARCVHCEHRARVEFDKPYYGSRLRKIATKGKHRVLDQLQATCPGKMLNIYLELSIPDGIDLYYVHADGKRYRLWLVRRQLCAVFGCMEPHRPVLVIPRTADEYKVAQALAKSLRLWGYGDVKIDCEVPV